MRGHWVEPTGAHDIGRTDVAVRRAEVHEVADLVIGPANYWFDTISDGSPNAAAAVFTGIPTAIADARPTFAAFAARTTIWRLALINGHGARVTAVRGTGRRRESDAEQRCGEDTSRNGLMSDR